MPTKNLLEILDRDARGLRFRSETDTPFDAIHWTKAEVADLSKDTVLGFLKKPADTAFQEIALETFFRNVATLQDWQDDIVKEEVPRYQKLVSTLTDNLTQIRVLRVGSIEIDVYIVGESDDGDWAGLHTLVVET